MGRCRDLLHCRNHGGEVSKKKKKSRRVFFHGDVEEGLVSRTIQTLYRLADEEEKGRITLVVSSAGGSLEEAFALCDVMRLLSCPITTLGMGKVMSCATMIMACGNLRYSMPSTQFMVHDVSIMVAEGSPVYVGAHADVGKAYLHRMCDILAEHSKRDADFWVELMSKREDTFFSAKRAKKYGLVDSVFKL